jgi:hypothetical protein
MFACRERSEWLWLEYGRRWLGHNTRRERSEWLWLEYERLWLTLAGHNTNNKPPQPIPPAHQSPSNTHHNTAPLHFYFPTYYQPTLHSSMFYTKLSRWKPELADQSIFRLSVHFPTLSPIFDIVLCSGRSGRCVDWAASAQTGLAVVLTELPRFLQNRLIVCVRFCMPCIKSLGLYYHTPRMVYELSVI